MNSRSKRTGQRFSGESPARTARRAIRSGVCALMSLTLCLPLPADDRLIPNNMSTYDDGRMPLEQLYQHYLELTERGWILDVIAQSKPDVRDEALPIIALRTPGEGEAVWILSGIHGEETAGPNAIAHSIDALAELGRQRAVVLLPLNNPHGYASNWRYLNMAVYSADLEGQSVGDSSHLLIDPDSAGQARAPAASSPEAEAITRYILETSKRYPPVVSLDLHEDNLISEGYVYSQGKLGAGDPLAAWAVKVLTENSIPLKMSGETRFGEPISNGIIGPVTDSSIDELMSAAMVVADGQIQAGPRAATVLVFETPAAAIPLSQRVAAHAALLKQLAAEIKQGSGQRE